MFVLCLGCDLVFSLSLFFIFFTIISPGEGAMDLKESVERRNKLHNLINRNPSPSLLLINSNLFSYLVAFYFLLLYYFTRAGRSGLHTIIFYFIFYTQVHTRYY